MLQPITFQTDVTNRPTKLKDVENLLAYSNEKVTDGADLKGRVRMVKVNDGRVLMIAGTVLCKVPTALDIKREFTTTLNQHTPKNTLWSVFTFTQNGGQLAPVAYKGKLTLVEVKEEKKNEEEDESANGYSYTQILAAAVTLLAVVALGTYLTGSFPFNAQKA